jgi:DNA-3-methyladenine glycosylase II
MDVSLVAPGPLDMARTLARFSIWGEDPASRFADGVLRRALRVDGRWSGYAISWSGGPDDTRIRVAVPGERRARVVEAALAETRRICGLDLDLGAYYRFAESDPVLGPLGQRLYGLRPTLAPRPFEMLVGAVCAQQVNLTWAFTVRARLVRRFGTPVRVGGQTVWGFPEPEVLARARPGELRRMQFTRRKAEYIVGLSRRVASGELDLDRLAALPNQAVLEALTAVRGFGRWTAEWFLARALGRGDVCPAGDLGVRRAFEHYYNRGRPLSEAAIRRRAGRWGPHQNVAVHYLLAGQRLEAPAARARASGGGT